MALTVIKPSGIDTSGNYTVTGMNVSANIAVANLSVTASANLGAVGNVIITGGTNGYVLQTDGSGTLSWVAQSGGGGSTSNISNGNSNVNIPSANGNINFSAVGNTVMVITGTGANISGTVNITGNATVGNLITNGGNITNVNVVSANTFIASSNITAGNANLGNLVTANFFTGNGSTLSSLTFGNITTFNTAGLTTDELYLQSTTRLNVTASGASGYLFDQYGATLNPSIYVTSGQTLAFNLNVSGHPFLIQTSGGANYSVGLEHVTTAGTVSTTTSAQGQVTGTLYWKIPYGITGNYKYICSIHGGMNGNIVITDANIANIQVGNALVAGTVYTNAQPNITSVGTLNSLTVNGNITGNNFVGAGAGTPTLSSITNLDLSAGVSVRVVGGGTLRLPNLTSAAIANLTPANGDVVYNTTINKFQAYESGAWSNVSDLTTTVLSTGSNSTAGTITGNWSLSAGSQLYATTANTVINAAQPNITSTGTLTSLAVTGNITSGNANLGNNVTANFFTGNGSLLTGITVSAGNAIVNGNSNVTVTANGNITTSVSGNANILIVTGTGVNVAGTLNITGNATVGNLTTSGSGGNLSNINVISANTFIASGNITAGNINTTGSGGNIGNANVISANTFTASGNITGANANLGNAVTANFFIGSGNNLSNIQGANVTGAVSSATTAGTVTTAAQPNIISVGTLTSLAVTGNVTSGNANLGNLVTANFFSGNGSLLTGITVSAGNSIVNGNSNVSVVANGNVNISAVGNANILVVTGTGVNVNGTLNVTGNTTVANLSTSGSGGNIGNANVISANTFIASGNITANNINTTGSGGNIGNANVISANTFTASGNITAGNANLGNSVTANYFTGNFYGTANLATFATTANSVTGGNVSGQVANALVASTVYTNAQPNITSVGTLTDLSVSGNGVFGGNLTVNGTLTYINSTTLSISDPIINLQTGPNGAAPVANTGKDVGTALNYYDTSAKIAWMGWDVSNAEIAFGSNVGISSEVVTFTSLANIRSGNASLGNLVTANFFTGNGSQISALTFGNITTFNTAGLTTDELYLQATTRLNVTASGASGYLFDQYGATLNPSLYVTSGQTLAFNLNVSGHPFLIQTSGGANYSTGLEHVGTTGTVLTAASAQGQVSGTLYWKVPYGITGNYKYICSIHGGMNGNIVVTDANVANITVGLATFATTANAVAGANISGQVSNALVSGTVYTNAQPNITSIGSLTGLTVSNATGIVDFTTTANVSLGAVGNVKITGGTNAYVLSTDGAGNLSWVAQSGGGGGGSSISNGNSNVNIPTSNGNINFTAVGNTNMVITGTSVNVAGILNTTGNVTFTGANVSLGAVGNVKITGGSNTFVLSTDGSGNLSWAAASGTSIGVDNFTGNGVQTAYTLTTTPANANATLVSIAGTFQPRTVYSLTGNVITFSSAPPNTAPIEVTTFTSDGGGGGGGITAQDLLSPFLLMGA